MKMTTFGQFKRSIGIPGQVHRRVPENGRDVLVIGLSGCAKDRRKQERFIRQQYPNARFEKHAPIILKQLNSGSVPVEEANTVQSFLRVYLKEAP